MFLQPCDKVYIVDKLYATSCIAIHYTGTSISILCYLQYHPNPLSSPPAAAADVNHNDNINEITVVKIL